MSTYTSGSSNGLSYPALVGSLESEKCQLARTADLLAVVFSVSRRVHRWLHAASSF